MVLYQHMHIHTQGDDEGTNSARIDCDVAGPDMQYSRRFPVSKNSRFCFGALVQISWVVNTNLG
jgi:hypothetical protein